MMKFNATMGTAVVPLLARLVLCAAFLTMGWNKIYHDHTFRGEDARILIELGVVQPPATGGAVGQPASLTRFFGRLSQEEVARDERAADRDDQQRRPDRNAADEEDETAGDALDKAVPMPGGPATRDPETGELVAIAKRMHTVTLIVQKHNGPSPVVMGWLATLTELIGGALLLIGLFSRIWGIGLAATMVVAFYLTSWPALAESGLFGIAADMTGGYANYNRLYVQAVLFVLAFGIFLTGAGPISLDRWLFRPSAPKQPDSDEDS